MSGTTPPCTGDSSCSQPSPADDRQFQEPSPDMTVYQQDLPVLCQPVFDDGQSLDGGGSDGFIEWARANGIVASASPANEVSIPLRSWVDSEGRKGTRRLSGLSAHSQSMLQRAGMLRKLRVAFALGKLLSHLKDSVSSYSQEELLQMCNVDNFAIQMSVVNGTGDGCSEIIGVDMISPPLSLHVIANSVDDENSCAQTGADVEFGKDVETVITRHSPFCCAKPAAQDEPSNERSICYALGVLLHFIFYESSTNSIANTLGSNPQELHGHNGMLNDFLRSLSINPDDMDMDMGNHRPTKVTRLPSQRHEELNSFYSLMAGPVSQLVVELLDCKVVDNAQDKEDPDFSLELVNDDLHLLLLEPTRFLFEPNNRLSITTKMHGRESEAKALFDGFKRVASSGQSEVLMVKGFSG